MSETAFAEKVHSTTSTASEAERSELPPAIDPEQIDEGIERVQKYLLSIQHEDGYWVGWLGNWDATLVSDYIMFMHFIRSVEEEKQRKCVRLILSLQNEEGGWSLYPGGTSDVSATVKAYFGLKLAGHSPDELELAAARKVIHGLGGLDQVNSFTKIYLAMFGQFSWHEVPTVPPELVLLPPSAYFNIYDMSSWSRGILVPLSIIHASRPYRPLPESAHISELFVYPRKKTALPDSANGRWTWEHFFQFCDGLLKMHDALPYKPLRKRALKKAEEWMLERNVDGGLAAVYPSMMNSIIAMKALEYPDDHPALLKALAEFEALMIEDDELVKFQPCFSPVWDTVITMIALSDSGLPPHHPALENSARWLLDKECKTRGDWTVKNPNAPTGGWFFEFDNEYYPDTDDTVMALMALDRIRAHERIDGAAEAMERGIEWLRSMQCDDGGWGAFDINNNKNVFEKVPFADHNALLDPATSDITSRILECFGQLQLPKDDPAAERAIKFLKRDQEPEGCWYGRWGVNYIYGTWQVLRGLGVYGEDMSQPYIQRGADWLLSIQNEDGGWGETCSSYEDPSLKGVGPSTPSQTAWALLGLMAAGHLEHPSVEKGVRYLVEAQRAEGGWHEDWFTGTGFPKVYYLEYTMYRHYFPLIALSDYQKRRNQT